MNRFRWVWAMVCGVAAGAPAGAAAPSRADGFDRSHPLGLEYYQPYGMVGMGYPTPHVAWARPLAGGPIRTLVLAPQWTHRETVELAQRLEIAFDAWMCFNTQCLTTSHSDPAFASYLVSQQVVVERLRECLAKPHDVIVIGKLRWAILPAKDRFEILRQVSRGTGLVYVCPPEVDRELAIVFSKPPNEGCREVLRGVPWRHLPRLRQAEADKLVRTLAFGQGRVVVLDYPEPRRPPEGSNIDAGMHSLTPNWVQVGYHAQAPRSEDPALELGPYEYYQSLVARAVRWAAGRDAPVKLQAALPEVIPAGTPTPVTVQVEGIAASIHAAVRTADGRLVAQAEGPRVALPALAAGPYRLDLWARDAQGQVLEWSSVAFAVQADQGVVRVEPASRLLQPGDRFKAQVELKRAPAPEETLVAELWDLHQRCLDRQALKPAGPRVEVDLGPVGGLHAMHELRLQIARGGAPLVEHRHRFPVRLRGRWDDFAEVVWASSDNSLPTFYMLRKLREHDQADVIDTLPGHAWRDKKPKETFSAEQEMDVLARNCATADLMICPYNSRFGVLGGGKNHVANPSLADPSYVASIAPHFRVDAQVYGPYGPFVWTHGDESHYSEDPDVDWHPAALERFRRLLREKLYGSLEVLNRQWGTNYTAWEQVMPLTYEEARRTGRFAPWLTHRLSSNVVFAEFYKQVGDVLREGDPGARSGFDGGCGLTRPNLGSDWWLLTRHIQLLHSYHAEDMQSEVFRSFADTDARTVRGMWYGTYGPHWCIGPNVIEYCHYHPWYSLFHHQNTTWFWTMGQPGPLSGFAPDLTSLAFMQARTQALREIKSGIGKLLLACPRADDAIAIHWSESSRIADSLFAAAPNQWSGAYVDALGGMARSLEDAGFQYALVAYEEIERGALIDRRFRVLFMPHSRAVSDREAEQILAFVRNGGVVVADILPATLTHTGEKRSASALAALFPTDVPGTVTPLGKGRAVLTGPALWEGYFDIHRSPEKGWPKLQARWRQTAALVKTHAGLQPAVRLEPLQGDMPPTEIVRFDADGIELVGLIRSYFLRDHQAYAAHVHFPRRCHVYDVRAGAYAGLTDRLQRRLDYQAELFALSPYKVESVAVAVGPAVAGRPLKIAAAVRAAGEPVTGKHVLRLTITGPDGQERPWYSQNLIAPKGQVEAVTPLALNEAPGPYTVQVKDVATGTVGRAQFTIQPGTAP